MYPEFIAIYVMLIIVIALLGTVLFFLIKLLKGADNATYLPPQQEASQYYGQEYQQLYQEQYVPQGGNVVFCQQCATPFDSSQSYCPNCGTKR